MIYFIERHRVYGPLILPLWQSARRGDATLLVSELAISEALALPLKDGQTQLVEAYESIAKGSSFRVEAVTWQVLRRAAGLRAGRLGLKMPDAIRLATAELAGCDAFVTNDKALRSVPSAPVIVLDDLI